MNLELTVEQSALRDAVRRYLADRAPVAGHVRALLDDPVGTTGEVWQGLAALGAPGILVPEANGGAGLSMVEAGLVAEELGRALHPGPWMSTAVASVRTLARLPASDPAEKLLRGIAEGGLVATVVLPDPALVTVARAPGGDGASLSGALPAVRDAAAADVVMVPVDVSGHVELWAVESSTDGVAIEALGAVDPTTKRFRVVLDAVAGTFLGTLPASDFRAVVDDVIVASASDALGAAQAVFELALAYAKSRVQFGQPIGAFQAVQHLCVDMLETIELARSGVLEALWAADHADAAERHGAALRCKAFAGRLAEVGDMAIQVFGGIGYTWEHDAHLYVKRLLTWSAAFGSPDHHLQEVGRLLVESVRATGGGRSDRRPVSP